MPNSLDRRITHHGTGGKYSTSSTTATAATSSNVLSSSENKPSLPVKRSKSMKSITKPVSLFFSNNSCVAPACTTPTTTTTSNNNKQLIKSHSVIESYEPPTRSDNFPKNSSVTRFDFENLPVNLPRRESADKDLAHVTESAVVPPPKPVRSNSEYANVFVQGSNPEILSAESVRNRISNYVSNNKASLSKPDSSNSLNDDAKKMLKDCQDYLVNLKIDPKITVRV